MDRRIQLGIVRTASQQEDCEEDSVGGEEEEEAEVEEESGSDGNEALQERSLRGIRRRNMEGDDDGVLMELKRIKKSFGKRTRK
ncbi:hypothetical protein NHQ30_009577 [Ciborinia camelliae]|nr:hypothetical protein NHQ30_009577 [Ciborinia camelliae]